MELTVCTGSCACSELCVAVVSQFEFSVSLILLSQGTKEKCGNGTCHHLALLVGGQSFRGLDQIAPSQIGEK
jgi:hypothetical protein